jgi:hypothetical protein
MPNYWDPAKAACLTCPSGQFYDINNMKCNSCPTGFTLNTTNYQCVAITCAAN